MKLILFWVFASIGYVTWANKYGQLWSGIIDPNNPFDLLLIRESHFADLVGSLTTWLIYWFIIALFFKNRWATVRITLVSLCVLFFASVLSRIPNPTSKVTSASDYVELMYTRMAQVGKMSRESFVVIQQRPLVADNVHTLTADYRTLLDSIVELEPPAILESHHAVLVDALQNCRDFSNSIDSFVTDAPYDVKKVDMSYRACMEESLAALEAIDNTLQKAIGKTQSR